MICSSQRSSMLSATSSFFIRWFVCRPESREGECPAHGWPCRFPDLQAVEKIKALEKKLATALEQCSGEPAPRVLTLRNILLNFLTAEVNLVDGAHGSWRMKKNPKKLISRHSHEEESSPQCDTIGLPVKCVISASFQYLPTLQMCSFTCVLPCQVEFTTPKIGTMNASKFSY